MKMSEFLALSDAEKVEAMPDSVPIGQVTEDKGICSICGGQADADDFCFGCHQLICPNCMENPKHKCV
ncbi:hypothetical protein LCGC14_1463680 [marine sediment metagenome]|uniref:B box-type domain-containing protein n=1 Tax=marine sediment metagenome TaxID=412755 RepID=A0A0F9MG62_9ZZZZ